jgi:hypothetical protein
MKQSCMGESMKKIIIASILALSTGLALAQDAQRPVRVGENVILSGQYYLVLNIASNGMMTLKNRLGAMARNIPRQQVAITRGCNDGICAGDKVLALSTGRVVRTLGISFNNRFVTESVDGWQTMTPNLRKEELALTRGCIEYARHLEICAGDTVRGPRNRDYKVIGLQTNGNVVIKSLDQRREMRSNVSPFNLVIVR